MRPPKKSRKAKTTPPPPPPIEVETLDPADMEQEEPAWDLLDVGKRLFYVKDVFKDETMRNRCLGIQAQLNWVRHGVGDRYMDALPIEREGVPLSAYAMSAAPRKLAVPTTMAPAR